jgi:phosphoglycerate kinase
MRYIDHMDVWGKRVLLRVDFNVPMDRDQKITDDWRIQAALPTIRYALDVGGRLIIVSHLDRPGGKIVPELSLAPVAERLAQLLEREVVFVNSIVGPRVQKAVGLSAPSSVVMLENLRFYPGEENDSDDFARGLAHLADVYIDDAFANAHRAHASNVGVTRFMTDCAGGLLMRRELEALGRVLDSPNRPLVAVVGGLKVSSKIGVLENLSRKVDKMLIGGAMAPTFFRALGMEMGDSVVSDESVQRASDILKEAEQKGTRIVLPEDLVVASKKSERAERDVVSANGVKPGKMALDIGPRTIRTFVDELKGAATILWNGPLGAFEMEPFSEGTRTVGEAIARSSAFTLVGGGDTSLALRRYGLAERISYVSTGGGAFLEALSGGELPAVKVLEEAERRMRIPTPI